MTDTAPSLASIATVHGRRVASPATRATTAAATVGGRDSVHSRLRLPARALLAFIWLYQRTLSPALPVLTLGRCACRFSPTCSHYAAQAIRTHGALAGAWLALRRLLKCTPLHPGGLDPVPVPEAWQAAPRCVRTSPAQPARLPPFA